MFLRIVLFGMLALTCAWWASATNTPRPSMPGGFREVDNINDAHIQDTVNLGANHIAAQPGHPCRAGLNVQRVQSQVVNGIKYRMTFRSNPALCPDGPQTAKICSVDVVRRASPPGITYHNPQCRNA